MDEKPECSQDLKPRTQQPTKKKENMEPGYSKNQLDLSKEQSAGTRTVLVKEQPAYSEDHSDAAKTLTTLTTEQLIYVTDDNISAPDQPINAPEKLVRSSEELVRSSEELVRSSEEHVHSPEEHVHSPEEHVHSPEEHVHSPEEHVHSLEEHVPLPDSFIYTSKGSVFSSDLLIDLADQPAISTDHPIGLIDKCSQPPIVLKEQSSYLNEQSPNIKTQPISTINQTVLSAEQSSECPPDQSVCLEDHSAVPKSGTVLAKNQSMSSTEVGIYSKEKAGYSKDQLSYSKTQTVLTTDHSIYLKEQSVNSIGQSETQENTTYSRQQPATCSKDQSALSRKREWFSKEEEIVLSTIHIDSTAALPSSSRQLLNTPRIVEVASTKYVSVFPKNEIAKLIGNSINIEYGICMSAVKECSSYNVMKNGYFLSVNAPLKINMSTQSPSLPDRRSMSLLPAPASVVFAVGKQPASLFLQALSKLNETSLALAVLSHFRLHSPSSLSRSYTFRSGDITPPDSLTSAPPTYSFVLRQIAGRRRPRFMGSFFPSPSFVQHTPPPTYTGAFDIYVEPPLPPPPVRTYALGYNSMPVICPECGYTGMTVIKAHVTVCTHCCACVLCLLCCWICAPLPYLLTSCKDVYHYCRNCRAFLGMYCPSNPDATSMYPNDLNR